jgi:hypothetical protein
MSAVLNRIVDVAEFDQYESERVKALQRLIGALKQFPKEAERSDFSDLFDRAQKLLELDDSELAGILRVSRPTVGRWARGDSAPHPIAREAVLKTFVGLADGKLKHHPHSA